MAITTTYQLRTFDDIVDAIMEELKYQSSDTVSRNRIKRDVQMVYLQEVVPFEQWKWLRGNVSLRLDSYYNTGTISVTQNSTAVTLSGASTNSKQGHYLSVVGQAEIYKIISHSAGGTAIVLDVPFIQATDTAASYRIWNDKLPLPVDCRDTVSVTTNYTSVPLEGVGLQQFRRLFAANSKVEARPSTYCTSDYVDPVPYSLVSGLPALSTAASSGLLKTLVFGSSVADYFQAGDRIQISASALHYSFNGEFVVSSVSTTTLTYTGAVSYSVSASVDASMAIKKDTNERALERTKELWLYPSMYSANQPIHVDYTKEAPPLVEDDDEPLMPISDRTVLLYGGAARAWTRERNPEEAQRSQMMFQQKLAKMAGKLDDGIDYPILMPSKTYLSAKRRSKRNWVF